MIFISTIITAYKKMYKINTPTYHYSGFIYMNVVTLFILTKHILAL